MSDVVRLDDQLCFALHAASRAMTGAYAPLLDALEVTYPQYLVLLTLWEEDGACVSRIGERLHLDSATLTPLLKRLEARELLTRRRSAEDERVVEIFLTAKGKRLEKRAANIAKELFCKTQLSMSELVRLREQLKELTHRLQAANDDT
jgi:DNA-binding MarR family transcriptional regulator